MLTISSVDVSRDLSVAKIYYTLFDNDEKSETQQGLQASSGFLRRQLSRSLTMRSVPELRFIYDDSVEQGNRMSALIDDAMRTNTTAAESGDRDAEIDGRQTSSD